MAHFYRCVAGVLLASALTACVEPTPPPSVKPPPLATDQPPPPNSVITDAQTAARDVTSGVVLSIEVAADKVLPARAPRPTERPVHPKVVAMLIRLEISSPAVYNAKYQWPIYPGGASGPTWCVGYDGGYQSQARIESDWFDHPSVDRLKTTSGIRGAAAKAMIASLRDILTPYAACSVVFETVSLPAYRQQAARLFRDGWSGLPWLVQDVLTSILYNRGESTQGPRRAEVLELVVRCVPANDLPCIENAIRSMNRLWTDPVTGRGLTMAYNLRADLVHEAIIEGTK